MLKPLRRKLFARWYDGVMQQYETWAGERRRALVEGLEGRVVELGPGTGANLPYLCSAADWAGVEPNEHMRAKLEQRAQELGRPVRWHAGLEELPESSVDAVVSTLVCCSVPDVDQTLREVRRVLRPGGRFVYFEHVAAPRGTKLRLVQRALTPVWVCLADGCHLSREFETHLRAAGFVGCEVERVIAPREAAPRIASPHVQGVALA